MAMLVLGRVIRYCCLKGEQKIKTNKLAKKDMYSTQIHTFTQHVVEMKGLFISYIHGSRVQIDFIAWIFQPRAKHDWIC